MVDVEANIDERVSDEESSSYTPKRGAKGRTGILGGSLNPYSRWVEEWNRAFLLVCALGLIVDPLFFYALSISGSRMCIFIDAWFAVTVTLLRCMADMVHVWNMWLGLRSSYRMRRLSVLKVEEKEHGSQDRKRVSSMVLDYLEMSKGFLFNIFIVLPVPQVVLWVVAPALISRGSTTAVVTVFLIMFLLQYLPKIYHSVCSLRQMQNSSGYVFGTIWWGIALNLIAYFVASHAAGACWYLLGVQRVTKCLKEQCLATEGCGARTIGCPNPIYYGTTMAISVGERLDWANNMKARVSCLDSSDNFEYGAFEWTLLLVTNASRLEKILLPIFWGLMTLSTWTLQSTTNWLEIVFSIIVITSGLLLFTMLIGNIKVFMHATTKKKQVLHLKLRNVDWWMRRKQLPKGIRQRVRQYERQRWAAMRGVEESKMIQNLPEGLRRDIKYHLCLDLVRQVPFFQHMDDLVLENICDRVKSLIFPKGEIISREGSPVKRMLFIVRGHMQSSQFLRDGVESRCMLGPGNFTGDELLSWCLRRPFVDRLPPSSSTLATLETTEAFGLESSDVKYVTQHFRYTFVSEKVKRSARYYSSGWRTWAAVAIQLAWRRHRKRMSLDPVSVVWPTRPAWKRPSHGEERLRHYTALLTSPKPDQDYLL